MAQELPQPPSYGFSSTIIVLLQGWNWITYEGWYAIKEQGTRQNQGHWNFGGVYTALVGGLIFMVDMLNPPQFNVNKVYISFAWNKAHGKR